MGQWGAARHDRGRPWYLRTFNSSEEVLGGHSPTSPTPPTGHLQAIGNCTRWELEGMDSHLPLSPSSLPAPWHPPGATCQRPPPAAEHTKFL